MQTSNEQSGSKMNSNTEGSTPQQHYVEQVIRALDKFYSVMGHKPTETGSIAMMAAVLVQGTTFADVQRALNLCMRECTFPVRLGDIQKRLPGREVPQLEAEMRKAWEIVEKYVRDWVERDGEIFVTIKQKMRCKKATDPNCEICRGGGWKRIDARVQTCPCREPYMEAAPELSPRIVDTVRRCGGWRTYALLTDEGYPFERERFMEEFQAWQSVVRIPEALLLVTGQLKELAAAKSIERPKLDRGPAPTPFALISPQKQRIMKAIEKARSGR
jgi:hypothetical protein